MKNLEVRRTIHATAERLFEVWTQPEYLKKWWGPKNVVCSAAEIDLQVGGSYRIANQFPDGKVLWISGTFEEITPPKKLVYSWSVESDSPQSERVTVRFEPINEKTEVIIFHEQIETEEIRDRHEEGWCGCMDGLLEYLEA